MPKFKKKQIAALHRFVQEGRKEFMGTPWSVRDYLEFMIEKINGAGIDGVYQWRDLSCDDEFQLDDPHHSDWPINVSYVANKILRMYAIEAEGNPPVCTAKRVLAIQADTNDADYVTESTSMDEITPEILENLRRILKVVKGKKGSNWNNQQELGMSGPTPAQQYKGKLTAADIDLLERFLPSGEYGIHTIESVKILEEVETLL
jgi:hypothetical protein